MVIAPTEHEMVPGWATIQRDGVATRYPPDPAKLFINTITSRDLFTSLKNAAAMDSLAAWPPPMLSENNIKPVAR